MIFGLFTCGYQRESDEQMFVDADAFGYDYIELWGGRPHGYAPDLVRGKADRMRYLSEKYRIPIRIFTPEHNAYPFNYMMGDRMQWEDSIEYLKTAIHASALLGAEAMLLSIGHSGGLSPKHRKKRLLCSRKILSEEAQKYGQNLLLEENLPNLQAMCDVVGPFVHGQDPVDYYRTLGSKMTHLHLTDSNGVDESHILPGDGIMDLKTVLHSFRSAGYDGKATIELVTGYINDPSGAAALAISRIKELL